MKGWNRFYAGVLIVTAWTDCARAQSNAYAITQVGLTGPDYTTSNGYSETILMGVDDAGRVFGHSLLRLGRAQYAAWVFDPLTGQTIDISPTDPQHQSPTATLLSSGPLMRALPNWVRWSAAAWTIGNLW